jgi:hypothetical protein
MNRREQWDRGFENRKRDLGGDMVTRELEVEDTRRKEFDRDAGWKPGMA